MLDEGKVYKFTIEKEIVTPDNRKCWVLTAPDKTKYLLPSAPYSGYGFKTGLEITCRIDRINCKGEIFLEPKHPFYVEGKRYDFPVVRSERCIDDSGNDITVIIVRDIYGNEIPAIFSEDDTILIPGSVVSLVVERVYKGRPVFNRMNAGKKFGLLKYGKSYDFNVERISKGINGEEYYILTDPFGNNHTIPKKYYEHYGIKTGTLIKCRIIKYSRTSGWKIEPHNPFYEKGSVIKMELVSSSPGPDGNSFTLSLKDKHGFFHYVITEKLPDAASVRCRVKGIKKGRPELIIL